MSKSKITVELVTVHIANDGTQTLEARFVDKDGRSSTQIEVYGRDVKLVVDDESESDEEEALTVYKETHQCHKPAQE